MSDDQNLDIYKKVNFIQHHLPDIIAGQFTLDLETSIKEVKPDNSGVFLGTDEQQTSNYKFVVKGDRYRITDLEATVFSEFPFGGSLGNYSNVLPHVLFKEGKKTLPWIRLVAEDMPLPTVGQEEDVPTWLALFLLDEEEMTSNGISLQNGIINDLLSDPSQRRISYSTALNLEPGEYASDEIQYIDLPRDLFKKIAPTLEDLKLLAHSREVYLDQRMTVEGISDTGTNTGTFSLVMGNRLPKKSDSEELESTVFMVCLENMANYLPGPDGELRIDDYDYIRLAVLKSWSFSSTIDTGTSFVDKVEGINKNLTLSETSMRMPDNAYQGDNPDILNALQRGYTPMNHHLRTGEQTVSWYRGPLAPYLIPPNEIDPLELPIPSADSVNIFDPTTGMLNVSYGMAWTLGRMLALQQKSFSTGLYQWKKQLKTTTINSVEEDLIRDKFQFTSSSMTQQRVSMDDQKTTTAKKTKRSLKKRLYTEFVRHFINKSKKVK